MNTVDATRQATTGRHGWDLIQAQDILSEIAASQRFLDIINTLLQESVIDCDPRIALLLDCYEAAAIPGKLQAAEELIESVRKALP